MPGSDSVIRNDEATSKDSLNRKQYATAFARLAETCETPLVIGLYGGWGIGKTSLMKLIRNELDKKKTCTVWFDPWRHQFDNNPALSLLHTVVETFKMEQATEELLNLIAMAFGSMFLKATTNLSFMSLKKLGDHYKKERFKVREAQVRLKKHFEQLIKRVQNEQSQRIVFFIDDLDRCSPKTALSLLEALKLYLNFSGCVYFLGVARQELEKSIGYHYKDIEISQTSYLDKIIQLPFTIPPIATDNMEEFIKPLLSEGLKECQELLVAGLGDNPRQVKRFINTLALNHQLASNSSIDGYDSKILTLLLLIQYLSPELYQIIANQPDRLLKLKEESEDEKDLQDEYLTKNEQLKEVLDMVEIPQENLLSQYIYLTQVAKVRPEEEKNESDLETILSGHKEWVENNGRSGTKAYFGGADLTDAELSETVLSYAYFGGADLTDAELDKSNLYGADLTNAYLGGANLQDTDLGNANLSGADLTGADLSNSNLVQSKLTSAFLNGADLTGADLTDVDLVNADLTDTDLSLTKGLTKEQLDSAKIDETTKLPSYLKEKGNLKH